MQTDMMKHIEAQS